MGTVKERSGEQWVLRQTRRLGIGGVRCGAVRTVRKKLPLNRRRYRE
jgi:hypothetical protein